MRSTSPRLAALVLVALAVACGGKSSPPTPPLTWTWKAIDGAVCSDGSPTGIGIEASPKPDADVIVFLDGGGACWSYETCSLVPQTRYGGFGDAELQARVASLPGSIFDRTVASNPYKDFTFVFVPYCTGDVHSGDKVSTYLPDTRQWHHHGKANLEADFAWLAANVGSPAKVVVSGSSAGGFGSLLAYTTAKARFPSGTKMYLVDDSGPTLPNVPAATESAWLDAWNLGATITAVCGASCPGSPPALAPIIPTLAQANPGDRFALISFTDDPIIEGFFNASFVPMSPADFLSGLQSLVSSIDATPTSNAHAFVYTGRSHTMLGNPAAYTSGGKTLFEWLGQQVGDDQTWSTATPF